jgi:hypothetical protein
MKSLIKFDEQTGLQLLQEIRETPGGQVFQMYSFASDPPRGLPGHLNPMNGDLVVYEAAFDKIRDYLIENPS